ncbi:MAG: hypothetical protein C0401_11255, partial [Anaerolinea sp.]|nr:hypothetical protein [Anaerolinea sp.]
MDNEDPQTLAEQIAKSEAGKYVDRIYLLKANFFVFDKNYHEILKIVKTEGHQKEMFELWDLKNRHLLALSINEVLRLLHNFLASSQSLVAQTRVRINKWYKGNAFLNEYQAQVNQRFASNPIAGFIQDLRDYNVHYSLPVSNATFSIHPTQEGSNSVSLTYSYV